LARGGRRRRGLRHPRDRRGGVAGRAIAEIAGEARQQHDGREGKEALHAVHRPSVPCAGARRARLDWAMSPPIRRLAAAMGVALMLAACGRTQLDLPATLPAEPVRVTASANGFEGEITIDGGIVAVPRLHELIEPRMRGLLAETQVM